MSSQPPDADSDPAPYPLYNTTFTLHRLSPLHVGSTPLTPPTLRNHASHFRDLLAGDVLRGVRVGLGDDDSALLARVGALRGVTWSLLPREVDWSPDPAASPSPADSVDSARGIAIDVVYEKALYTALLLRRDTDTLAPADNPDRAFASYPLLLTRMPAPLRATLLAFLASTFDARAAPLRLPAPFLSRTLETYLAALPAAHLRAVTKDIFLSLAPTPAGPSAADDGLRGIDLTIPRDSVAEMLERGRRLEAADARAERAGAGGTRTEAAPFAAALGRYVDAKMGLDTRHAGVGVGKVACGAFVLGGEGKLKIFEPREGEEEEGWREASGGLVEGLVEWAGRGEIG